MNWIESNTDPSCREGNHQSPGPHCHRCGQWIGEDILHLQWVKDGKVFDTETANRLHTIKYTDGMPREAMFISPNEQFFAARADTEGNVKGRLLSKRQAKKWLERHQAPSKAFEDGGWSIEEG